MLCCAVGCVACQVLENLLLAAKLRLPVSGKGQGVAAAAWRHVERQRHREVHKVVGEVMALMGLTQVATTVSEAVVSPTNTVCGFHHVLLHVVLSSLRRGPQRGGI
jgi:hypothetical protein